MKWKKNLRGLMLRKFNVIKLKNTSLRKKNLQCAADKRLSIDGCVSKGKYCLRPIYFFTEKLRPRQGYRLVASKIFESDLFSLYLESFILKINK